jgi:hypothetical protein
MAKALTNLHTHVLSAQWCNARLKFRGHNRHLLHKIARYCFQIIFGYNFNFNDNVKEYKTDTAVIGSHFLQVSLLLLSA